MGGGFDFCSDDGGRMGGGFDFCGDDGGWMGGGFDVCSDADELKVFTPTERAEVQDDDGPPQKNDEVVASTKKVKDLSTNYDLRSCAFQLRRGGGTGGGRRDYAHVDGDLPVARIWRSAGGGRREYADADGDPPVARIWRPVVTQSSRPTHEGALGQVEKAVPLPHGQMTGGIEGTAMPQARAETEKKDNGILISVFGVIAKKRAIFERGRRPSRII